jgi:hypothetical protein
MSSYRCKICNEPDHFWFKWSTSRYFNRQKVLEVILKRIKILSNSERIAILKGDYRVCGRCCEKHNIMKSYL